MISHPGSKALDILSSRHLRYSFTKRPLPWFLNRNKSALLRPRSPQSARHFQILRTVGAPANPGLEADTIRDLEVEQLEGVGEVEEVGVDQTRRKTSDVQNGRMSIALPPQFCLD